MKPWKTLWLAALSLSLSAVAPAQAQAPEPLKVIRIGVATGENRALDAAQQATNSALLEASIAGASRVLFSISGGPDLTLTEVDEAARTVEACADENANIIYGQIIDESMGFANARGQEISEYTLELQT